MKREIKFRGQDKVSKQFVFGDLIHGVGFKKGNIYILPLIENLASVPHCDPLDGVLVLPETVGQFTGLTDKNNNLIYEGDICRLVPKAKYNNSSARHMFGVREVIYYSGIASYFYDSFVSMSWGGFEFVEIIGNIHENPELLSRAE